MHITERLLNICYFLEKTEKTTKKIIIIILKKTIQKKYSNKLTFQMQRCRLRLTALTLQSTR